MNAELIEQITSFAQFQREKIFPTLDPDDDPVPMLILLSTGRQDLFGVVGDREQYPAMIEKAVAVLAELDARPTTAVFCTAAWVVAAPGEIEGRPSEHPERKEMMTYLAVGTDGSAYVYAPIMRTAGAQPTMGEITVMPQASECSGRIYDALAKAVR